MYPPRKEAADGLCQRFETFLKQYPQVEFRNTGIEEMFHKSFHERLKTLSETNPFADEIRKNPDYTVLTETEVIYYDCKATKDPSSPYRTIQRDAYNDYIKRIQKYEMKVRLIYETTTGDMCSVDPRELAFIRDPIFKNSWQIPVEEEIWRCPRKMSPERYEQWHAEFPFASGTSLGYFSIVDTPKKLLK